MRSDETAFPIAPLFSTRDAFTCGYEYALDNNDNVVVHPAHDRKCKGPNWQRFLPHYLQTVDDYLDGVLMDADSMSGLDAITTGRTNATYQLRYAEHYWEYQHHDPIRLAHELRPRLRAIGRYVQETEYLENVSLQETQHHNAVSYRITIAQGVELAIYAKTNRRIRLEIRHRTADLQSGARGLPTSFEFHSVREVCSIIERLGVDAQNHLNAVIDILTADLDEIDAQHSPYDLVREIMNACDWAYGRDDWPGSRHRNAVQTAYDTVISSLIIRNSYRLANGDPHRTILRKLTSRHVVVNDRWGGRTYRLTDQYQRARETLIPPIRPAY